jgi:hypothetical protein
VSPPISYVNPIGQVYAPPYASLLLYGGRFQPWGIDFNAANNYLGEYLRRCAVQLLGTVALVANIAKMILERPAFAAAWNLARTFLATPSNLLAFEEIGAVIAEMGLVLGAANLLGIIAAVAGAGVATIAIYKCIAAGA